MRLVLRSSYETGIANLHKVGWHGAPPHFVLTTYGGGDVWELDWQRRRIITHYCPLPSLRERFLRRITARQRISPAEDVTLAPRPLHQVRGLNADGTMVIDSQGAETYLVDLQSDHRTLLASGDPTFTAAFDQHFDFVALGGYAHITLLGPHRSRVFGKLAGHKDGVRDMTFSPDGRLLVSVGGESEDERHRDAIRLWDVQSQRELHSWMWHHLGAVAFHPRGEVIAVGCMMPGAIKVWDIAADTIDTVDGEDLGAITALCFSPDGSCLCAGNRAGRLMIFEVSDYS